MAKHYQKGMGPSDDGSLPAPIVIRIEAPCRISDSNRIIESNIYPSDRDERDESLLRKAGPLAIRLLDELGSVIGLSGPIEFRPGSLLVEVQRDYPKESVRFIQARILAAVKSVYSIGDLGQDSVFVYDPR